MTVIATDGKVMVGDGRITANKSMLLSDTFRKVRRLKDGRVFGGAGDVGSIVNAFDWLEAGAPGGEDRPSVDKDTFEGLLLDSSGLVYWFDDDCVMVPYDPPFAIGVGSEVAVALMRRGFSPREAVRAAIETHVTCGGEIVTLKPTTKRTR